ncbi:hypothetical protein A0H81_00335 [Grifola frondosa]|uniref:Uncharacterized protein n=1 Tax=Grifola frondosa TaxID=5627 RepID=A0A1C7MSB1_GRIFR|nr:hypothetical protein A0H81_00335 [Grifola frondosa]
MAPLSLSRIFSGSSRRSETGRRRSVDSIDSSNSFVIALPSMHPTLHAFESRSTAAESGFSAEMLDDDNFAWGRPKSSKKPKSRR